MKLPFINLHVLNMLYLHMHVFEYVYYWDA